MNICKLNNQLLLTDYTKALQQSYYNHFRFILYITYDEFLNRICNDLNIINQFLEDDIYQFQTLLYGSKIILGGLELTSEQSKRLNETLNYQLPNIFFIAYDKQLNICNYINIFSVYKDMIYGKDVLV